MAKTGRRRGKLSEEEIEEVNNFVYSKNIEEDKYLKTMSINTKCRNENQKKLVNSIKENEITIVSGLPGTGKTFLPGDMKEKLEPYMISFIDNFEKIIGESLTKKLRELGIIQIQPLAFIRGRSIDNTIIVVDEAQNISRDNMRTLMTRIGDNSKMVILGDVKQKDIKNKNNSSLETILEKFRDHDGFGCVELRDPNDVVRNPIIKIIESTFDEIEG